MKDYEKALAELKPGDTVYELHAVYNYPEEGGGLHSIQVCTAVVKEIVTEHIETITHKTVNGNSVPEEKAETFKQYIVNTRGSRCSFTTFDGTHDWYLSAEDVKFAKKHWNEFHDGDVVTHNFWDLKKKYRNIEKHKDEYTRLKQRLNEIERE